MSAYRETTHLSEILEESAKKPVIVFKYSNSCKSSSDLDTVIAEKVTNGKIVNPVYKVTVQTQPVLSGKIEEWFGIKHESPQVFIIEDGRVTYTEHHKKIDTDRLT